MSENDIINLAQKREDAAMEYLLEKYKPLVRQKTRKLFLIDGDKDDLIQEGMIGLLRLSGIIRLERMQRLGPLPTSAYQDSSIQQ